MICAGGNATQSLWVALGKLTRPCFVRMQATGENVWTDQDTLLLLEGLELYGDNWAEVADHVGTKSQVGLLGTASKATVSFFASTRPRELWDGRQGRTVAQQTSLDTFKGTRHRDWSVCRCSASPTF